MGDNCGSGWLWGGSSSDGQDWFLWLAPFFFLSCRFFFYHHRHFFNSHFSPFSLLTVHGFQIIFFFRNTNDNFFSWLRQIFYTGFLIKWQLFLMTAPAFDAGFWISISNTQFFPYFHEPTKTKADLGVSVSWRKPSNA